MPQSISPTLVGLGVIALAAFIFMYEYPSALYFPFNFLFAGLLVFVLIVIGVRIVRE
ncbi:MAG: hypothetical protein ACREBQ_09815 [Nitrososphaerales archaeon]